MAVGQEYFHLVLIGNTRKSPTDNAAGSVSDVIRPMLLMATEIGWPVCLEATSLRSRDIYAHLGFETVRELKLGVGHADESGRPVTGGNGVSVWLMIYRPTRD